MLAAYRPDAATVTVTFANDGAAAVDWFTTASEQWARPSTRYHVRGTSQKLYGQEAFLIKRRRHQE